jgi:hypothetical protein
MLKSDNYDIKTFDAYSMFFNKTRHIDYYLKHNISLEEIELIKKYGTSNEVKHALGDNQIGDFLGKIASNFIESKFNDVPDKKNFKLSTSIKEATKPIILYSSGINDIMYQSCIDPFSAKGYFKKEKNKYYYALDRVKGDNKEKNMDKIIDGHKSNFEKLLSLNSNSKILALSAYLYSVGEEYDKPFMDFVILYNERLEKLCKEYQINYIDLRFLEHTRYQSAYHTYFESFSKQVANKIILELSNSIKNERTIYNSSDYNYDNEGSRGMLSDMVDYRTKLFETDSKFASRKSQELSREESVIKKVEEKLNNDVVQENNNTLKEINADVNENKEEIKTNYSIESDIERLKAFKQYLTSTSLTNDEIESKKRQS